MNGIKRGIAGIIGIGIIVGILLFCSGRYGDPLSEVNAKRRAAAYAQKLYPEKSFLVQGVRYMAPFVYIVDVQANESVDTHFSIKVSRWIQVSDQLTEPGVTEHERLVENAWNTGCRMGREAAEQAERILEKELPKYEFCTQYDQGSRKVQIDIGYEPETFETENGYREIPEQYRKFLPLNQRFEPVVLHQVPARLAAVVSWPEDPTEADLKEVLTKMKNVLEENGMPFAYYHITLLHKSETGVKEEIKQIGADNVSAEQIG